MNYADLKDFKPGTRLTYADGEATVSDGMAGLVTGTVNGPPITDDEGNVSHVPVFTERDNGREATTVYVAVTNIVGEIDDQRKGKLR